MKKTMKILNILLSISVAAALSCPAFALEYSFDEAPGMAYGKPTSIEAPVTADGGAAKNEDISKPPAFRPPSGRLPATHWTPATT